MLPSLRPLYLHSNDGDITAPHEASSHDPTGGAAQEVSAPHKAHEYEDEEDLDCDDASTGDEKETNPNTFSDDEGGQLNGYKSADGVRSSHSSSHWSTGASSSDHHTSSTSFSRKGSTDAGNFVSRANSRRSSAAGAGNGFLGIDSPLPVIISASSLAIKRDSTQTQSSSTAMKPYSSTHEVYSGDYSPEARGSCPTDNGIMPRILIDDGSANLGSYSSLGIQRTNPPPVKHLNAFSHHHSPQSILGMSSSASFGTGKVGAGTSSTSSGVNLTERESYRACDPRVHYGWFGPALADSMGNGKSGAVITRTRGRRVISMMKAADVALFDRVAAWRAKAEGGGTLADAWEIFGSKAYSSVDAILKLHFGVRRYDYVLKFKHSVDPRAEGNRTAFEKKLLQKGLIIERELSVEEKKMVYVKILAPFNVLCAEAQLNKLKLPLKPDEAYMKRARRISEASRRSFLYDFGSTRIRTWLNQMKSLFITDAVLEDQSGVFKRKNLAKFRGGDPSESSIREVQSAFFRDSHRSLLVNYIITRTEIKIKDMGSLSAKAKLRKDGIYYLLAENVYTSMFHVHDDDYLESMGGLAVPTNPTTATRLGLKKIWVTRYFSPQPMNEIASYFGEKVALYFAFMGFYNAWLALASILGLVVFIYGLSKAASGPTFVWAKIFDNEITPWFGLLISLWALLMPLAWQQRLSYFSWQWSTNNFEREEVRRPQFKPSGTRRSEVTGKLELYFPARRRFHRQLASTLVMALWLLIVAASIAAQVSMGAYFAPVLGTELAMNSFTSLLGLVSIVLMKVPFKLVVELLNDWENYKTESHYDNAYIIKSYLFDFANSYSQLLYYAFVKPNMASHNLFGLSILNDDCNILPDTEQSSTCSSAVTINLLIIFIGGQLIERAQELGVPWIAAKFSSLSAKARKAMLRREILKKRRRVDLERGQSAAAEVNMFSKVDDQPEEALPEPVLESNDTSQTIIASVPMAKMSVSATEQNQRRLSHNLGVTPEFAMSFSEVEQEDYLTNYNEDSVHLPQHYRDDKLVSFPGIRDEYAQKVIQFGYIALFASCFPLAPIFALINNVYEVRSDAFKLLYVYQRPVPLRAPSIGAWEIILRIIAALSVATNSTLIAFLSPTFQYMFLGVQPSVPPPPSEAGTRMAGQFLFIILFHYGAYFLAWFFGLLIPAVPTSVELAMARAEYMERINRDKDLEEEDEMMSVDTLMSTPPTLLAARKKSGQSMSDAHSNSRNRTVSIGGREL
ncbi:calcium-activated chloride channel-domain-containing protein [Zopfochytrium polystomum]|nr:calcium-activated chloride channel-domain-containing protein [Zopfochytrium polystomum]